MNALNANSKRQFVAVMFGLLILLAFGGVWSVMAQDGTLPLPLSGSREFTQSQILTASDGVVGNGFGTGLAVDGDTLLVSSSFADPGGKAYIFARNSSGNWLEVTPLVGNDTVSGDGFGNAVALEGNTAVVAAYSHDMNVVNDDDEGAVYIFTRDGAGLWTQWQKLTVPVALPQPETYFGFGLDMDADRLVITASGTNTAYIFRRNSSQLWQIEDDFAQPSVWGVAIEGETLLIGDANENANTGSVSVYQIQAGGWQFVQKLTASDGKADEFFGSTVELQNGQAFIQASNGDASGAVYVFTENGGIWSQTQKIVPNDPDPSQSFGIEMSIDDQTLALGSPYDTNEDGSVYIFGWNGSAWVQQDKILSEITAGSLGYAVALEGSALFSSTIYADSQKGRVYVYSDPDLIPTPTAGPSTELLVDGGFEANTGDWEVQNSTGDKVKCNKEGKIIAYTGNCAWRFKGGAGENSKIQQVITSGFNTGDTIALSGYVNTSGAVSSKVKVVVSYLNTSLEKSKITVNLLAETGGSYVPLSAFQPALTTTVTAPPEKIKVQIKNSSTSGKLYYDDLSLTVQ